MNARTKITEWWKRYWKKIATIFIVAIIYLYPFYCLGLNKWPGWDLGELYTFGLELKDFFTMWVTLGGVVAVVIGIFQTQGRISLQKEQFEKQQRNARFASGFELLGNPHESTRIGGAYNLYFLAREFPDDYLNPVCEILCTHLRSIAHKDKFKTDEERTKYPRNEVQSIIDLLFKERDEEMIFKDVKGKNLSQIFLSEADFDKAELIHVNFSGAKLIAYSSSIHLKEVKLNHIDFGKAELRGIYFDEAKLTSVDFRAATISSGGFEDSELKEINFMSSTLTNINLSRAKLESIIFAKLINVRFKEAVLKDVDFCMSQKLSDVRFNRAKLVDMVDFSNATILDVDFSNAIMGSNINFEGTKLEGYTIEEIVKPGRSLELTAEGSVPCTQ